MKQGIHPDYHPVVFRDRSANFTFLTRSTAVSDGTMLVTLYQAIVERTGRGRRIGEFPLLMVGADPSPVARQVAAIQKRNRELSIVGIVTVALSQRARRWTQFQAQVPQFL